MYNLPEKVVTGKLRLKLAVHGGNYATYIVFVDNDEGFPLGLMNRHCTPDFRFYPSTRCESTKEWEDDIEEALEHLNSLTIRND